MSTQRGGAAAWAPQRAKAAGLGCTVPVSSLKQLGYQGRYQLWTFQAGVGLWALDILSQGLDMPASSTCRVGAGKALCSCLYRPADLFNLSWTLASLGFLHGISPRPPGQRPSRGIGWKSLWQGDHSTEPMWGLSTGIHGCNMPVWEAGEPSLSLISCVILASPFLGLRLEIGEWGEGCKLLCSATVLPGLANLDSWSCPGSQGVATLAIPKL